MPDLKRYMLNIFYPILIFSVLVNTTFAWSPALPIAKELPDGVTVGFTLTEGIPRISEHAMVSMTISNSTKHKLEIVYILPFDGHYLLENKNGDKAKIILSRENQDDLWTPSLSPGLIIYPDSKVSVKIRVRRIEEVIRSELSSHSLYLSFLYVISSEGIYPKEIGYKHISAITFKNNEELFWTDRYAKETTKSGTSKDSSIPWKRPSEWESGIPPSITSQ